jgi:phosphodiesterase/alkaline phosphatase D-like protein
MTDTTRRKFLTGGAVATGAAAATLGFPAIAQSLPAVK